MSYLTILSALLILSSVGVILFQTLLNWEGAFIILFKLASLFKPVKSFLPSLVKAILFNIVTPTLYWSKVSFPDSFWITLAKL